MKRNTFRIILVLATIAILSISITQMFWVRQTLQLKEKEFSFTVSEALKNVAQGILEYNKNTSPLINPVHQLRDNYFIVKVNDKIDPKLLEGLLRNEFIGKEINDSYEYFIYDCMGKRVSCHAGVGESGEVSQLSLNVALPQVAYDNYYFGIYFPKRPYSLITRFDIWSFSTIISLLVVIFFAYAIVVVLKQKRLSEIQNDFVNNMTHEFKTPLSTIYISSEVLKDKNIIHTPERLASYVTIIQQEATKLKNHVERVLQMASLEKEEIKLNKEPVNAHQAILHTVNSPYFSEVRSCIQLHLDAEEMVISADPLHFSNVIFNILDNAVKYSSDNVKIEVRTDNVNGNLSMTISDNGIGIPAEHRKKIFDKFFRVPQGDVHNVKGFGLGLNYVKHLVNAHRGVIQLTSELNVGSSFTIFMPLNIWKK